MDEFPGWPTSREWIFTYPLVEQREISPEDVVLKADQLPKRRDAQPHCFYSSLNPNAKLVTKKRYAVGQCSDPFAERKDGRMAAEFAVIEQNRIRRNIRGLQSCCHLSRMKGIAVGVSVARDQHYGRIRNTVPYVVIGRIARECRKVSQVLGRAILLGPDVRTVEEVIAQH